MTTDSLYSSTEGPFALPLNLGWTVMSLDYNRVWWKCCYTNSGLCLQEHWQLLFGPYRTLSCREWTLNALILPCCKKSRPCAEDPGGCDAVCVCVRARVRVCMCACREIPRSRDAPDMWVKGTSWSWRSPRPSHPSWSHIDERQATHTSKMQNCEQNGMVVLSH